MTLAGVHPLHTDTSLKALSVSVSVCTLENSNSQQQASARSCSTPACCIRYTYHGTATTWQCPDLTQLSSCMSATNRLRSSSQYHCLNPAEPSSCVFATPQLQPSSSWWSLLQTPSSQPWRMILSAASVGTTRIRRGNGLGMCPAKIRRSTARPATSGGLHVHRTALSAATVWYSLFPRIITLFELDVGQACRRHLDANLFERRPQCASYRSLCS